MMNELASYQSQQLPDTLEDLSKFVLVKEEQVQALRAQIRAIKKVALAKEVYEQKLAEAQEIGQITVEAAQKMGELLLQIQKQSGARTDLKTYSTNLDEVKTKTEITSEMGMTKDQVSQYQQMAQNPEAVQIAIEKAIERGDVVSRSQVMKQIAEAKRKQQEENDKLRQALSESETKRILAENKKVKEVVREVEIIPNDYEQTKKDLDSFKKDYKRMVNEKQKIVDENLELKSRIRDLENPTAEEKNQFKLEEESEYFVSGVYTFVKRYAGDIWIFDQIDKLPEEKRRNFEKAIYSLDALAKQLVENIGGYKIE